MCASGTKLNRSCSDSDLNKVNFDNLCLDDQFDGFEKNSSFVTRRILFVEEVIRCDSPDTFRRGTTYQSIGRSTPEHLNNLDISSVANMVINNQFLSNSILNRHGQHNPTTNRKKINDFMNREDIEPMEIDILHNTSKSDDCTDFVETMDVDINPQNCENSRHNSLNIIKKRNVTKPTDFTDSTLQNSTDFLNSGVSEVYSENNRTKITPIARFKNKDAKNACILVTLLMFILFFMYVVFFYDSLYVNSDVQCYHIERELTEKVHGQNASRQVIVRTLQQREQWFDKIKVLSFVGSTGVGKTFVANLVKKHFLPELAHKLFGMHLNYESQTSKIINSMRSCCLNLIVIDDLKRKDTTELFAFIHNIPKDYFVLVLSIFNIQYTNDKIIHKINYTDIIEIRNEFDNSGLHQELIVFEEFNEVQVKDWMKKQLTSQNVTQKLQNQILRSVLKGHDAKYNGLKGLYAKVLLEIEKHAH